MTISGLALSAFVVACGDDDTTNPPVTPGTDSGTDANRPDTGTGTDSGPTDSGTPDADATTPPAAAKLQLVNAAGDMGPNAAGGGLRICFRIGQNADGLIWAPGLPPLPNRKSASQPFPGLFIGTGGSPETTGTDLSTLIVEPYLVSAQSLEARGLGSTITSGQDKDCETILGKAGDGDAGAGVDAGFAPLEINKDFWKLTAFPVGTFLQEKSYLLVLTGCPADADPTVGAKGACGNDWVGNAAGGNGNLTIRKYDLDRATVIDQAKFGLQFVHAAPNADIALQAAGGVKPEILAANDAGAHVAWAVGDGGTDSVVTYSNATALVQASGVTPASDYFSANAVAAVSLPFQVITQFTYGGPAPDGGALRNGAAFTFIALGDATQSPVFEDGGANLRGIHFLALPNDPSENRYDPNK